MTKRTAKKEQITDPSELETKVRQADPVIRYAIAGYKKEIERLNKQLVKERIAHESEKANLLARLEQERIQVNLVQFGEKKT